MKFKKGDKITMLSGKDRGKQGKIVSVFPKEDAVIVEGLNLITKHQKPLKQGKKGQRIQIPRKISAGKTFFLCPQCSQGTRIGYRFEGEKKERICKKCQATV